MNIVDPYLLSNLQQMMDRVLQDRNYVDLRGERYVRIPKIEGRFNELENMDDSISLEFIYKRWYDEEARQSRNRKLVIGHITPQFPRALRVNENYDKFFDYETGELKEPYRTEILQEQKEEKKEQKEQKAPAQPRSKPKPDIPRPVPASAPSDSGEEEERIRREREKREEEDRERFMRDLRENRRKFRLAELKKKIQGEELERQKELFGDEALGEFQAMQARRRLEKVLSRIRREVSAKNTDETTKNETDMTKEEENSKKVNNEAESEEEDLEEAFARYTREMERIAILFKILQGVLEAIRNQSKKKPNEIINSYKARTINQILEEIREQYKDTGYLDLLGLLEEPGEEQTEDGRTVQTGMTYSDAEVLLEHYAAITKFARVKTFKIDD